MKRKYITIPAAILAAVIAVGWLAAPSVQAHNALATPSCSGLAWSATNYQKELVNSLTVKVDGAIVHQDPDFKASDVGNVAWSQTANHAWSVVVNAPGTEFDRAFSGTWQACQTVPTTTVAQTTTTQPTTTTVPATTVPATTLPATTLPAPTTTVPAPCDTTGTVASCFPPVPPTTVAAPPSTVVDVSSLTPAVEPPLPVTGAGDTILILGCALVASGVFAYLVAKGRRVR